MCNFLNQLYNLVTEEFNWMRRTYKILLLTGILITLQAFGPKRIDYRKGMYKNVCKGFTNEILVYVIFVDSKETAPWTEFDIQTTLDSLQQAVRWLEMQAKKYDKQVKIKTDYYIGEYATIKKSLPGGSVKESLTEPNIKAGIREMNNWADYIAKRAGATFNIVEKDGIPEVQNPRNKERLIAHLRDENNVESVALLFMVNNYFQEDMSVAINTLGTEEIEFAVVSYKYPSEIAHNILHLYGAADLYETPFRRDRKKAEQAKKLFPGDIMQDPYAKKIQTLEIGEFTRYLIGWTDDLDQKYHSLLTDNSFSF